jgi:hypothetical protein
MRYRVVIPDLGTEIDDSPAARRAVALWLVKNARVSENLPLVISPQLAVYCSYWLQHCTPDV